MSQETILEAGRRRAESRMTSAGNLRRKTGQTVKDGRGLDVPEWTTVYTGLSSRISGTAGSSSPYRTTNVGGGNVTIAARVLNLPFATSDLRDGDFYEVTGGENAGLVLQVVEATWQDNATARRVPAVEIQRPKEWS